MAAIGMVVSGWLLWLAQRHIPIGTDYAAWTGIGAAGTFHSSWASATANLTTGFRSAAFAKACCVRLG